MTMESMEASIWCETGIVMVMTAGSVANLDLTGNTWAFWWVWPKNFYGSPKSGAISLPKRCEIDLNSLNRALFYMTFGSNERGIYPSNKTVLTNHGLDLHATYLVHHLVGSFNHVLHPQKEMMIPNDCSVFQGFGMVLEGSPGACGKTNIQPICFHKWMANDSPFLFLIAVVLPNEVPIFLVLNPPWLKLIGEFPLLLVIEPLSVLVPDLRPPI